MCIVLKNYKNNKINKILFLIKINNEDILVFIQYNRI